MKKLFVLLLLPGLLLAAACGWTTENGKYPSTVAVSATAFSTPLVFSQAMVDLPQPSLSVIPTATPNANIRFLTADDVSLRDSASSSGNVMKLLKKDTPVILESVVGSWTLVELNGGVKGYIFSSYLTVQCPPLTQDSVDHTHVYITTQVAATCTAGGYYLHVCACGDSYKSNFTSALGHKLIYTDVNSSVHKVTCARCSYTVTQAHSYHNGVCACGRKQVTSVTPTTEKPTLQAAGAILVDLDYGTLVTKASATQCRPASLTKMMTLLVAYEHFKGKENTVITVTADGVSVPAGSSTAGLAVGNKLTVNDLYYAMMLPSGNDAAKVLAIAVAGSETAFVKQMNAKAASLGLKNTHFVNCHGMDATDHISTPQDLATLAKAVIDIPALLKVVSTYQYTASVSGGAKTYYNTNPYLNPGGSDYSKYVYGVKTGYTSKAGNCLITFFNNGSRRFLTVVVGEPGDGSRITDTNALLAYGLACK